MMAVDTNVLIYAHRTETPKHEQAKKWLISLAEGSAEWAIPAACIAEFLRVTTHRRIFDPPSTVVQSTAFLDALMGSPSLKVICPGCDFYSMLTELVRSSNSTGNLVFDAQIAAICRENGVSTLLTEDRDFLRFPGLKIITLDTEPA
ncbi:MAG: TA system VapC family ribonuclease toxin [Myxococcota bacterium]|jgi:hypothetical protein